MQAARTRRILRALAVAAALCLASPPGASQTYEQVRIALPAQGSTVFDNAGAVGVQVELSPALRAGDRIVLLVDGSPAAESAVTRIRLENLERGEHRLQARVISEQGAVVGESPSVRFEMWRASRLFPGRKQ